MKKKILLLSTLIFFFTPSAAFACEPCPKILNLAETIEEAQFIIIGQKVARCSPFSSRKSLGDPDCMEVKINQVLKGTIDTDKIKVATFYGMCPYGITTVKDDRFYMMFLAGANREMVYEAVRWGCSVKALLVENDTVKYKGERISTDEFAARFGLQKPTMIK